MQQQQQHETQQYMPVHQVAAAEHSLRVVQQLAAHAYAHQQQQQRGQVQPGMLSGLPPTQQLALLQALLAPASASTAATGAAAAALKHGA